jgi:MoxR-like ATPase
MTRRSGVVDAATAPLDEGLDHIDSVKKRCAAFRELFATLRAEVAKAIVGQDEIVEQVLIALFANGHVLLEGVPGLGKTLLVTTLSTVLDLSFARIQFTPDLMPADITGTSIVLEDPSTGKRQFEFRPGPLFHQLILADEVNRATPKSQAALLEAMQERSVSAGGQTRRLAEPFLVMATQNPIEQEGTYPLPEAQLDRFLLKVVVPYATREEVATILTRTTANHTPRLAVVLDGPRIQQAQRLARRVLVAPPLKDFIVRVVLATHAGTDNALASMEKYIAVGVSPRGAQAMITAAKVKALLDGRYAIAFRDIESIAAPCLRHRIKRSFEAEADGVTTDAIVRELLRAVPRETGDMGTSQQVNKSTLKKGGL